MAKVLTFYITNNRNYLYYLIANNKNLKLYYSAEINE